MEEVRITKRVNKDKRSRRIRMRKRIRRRRVWISRRIRRRLE